MRADPDPAPAPRPAFPVRVARAALRAFWSGFVTALAGPDPPVRASGRWVLVGRVLAAVAGVVAVSTAVPLYEQARLNPPASFALAVAIAVPLVLTAYRPVLAWRLAWVAMIVSGLNADVFPSQPWPWHPLQLLAYPFLLWRAATRVSRPAIAWMWLFSVYAVVPFVDAANMAVLMVVVTGEALLADQVRRRRDIQRGLAEEERRGAAEKERRTLLEERARIARELHDVVAHHMSLVAVRAETAPYRLGEVPDSARDEFAGIAATARDALTEMRRLLGVLRSEAPDLELAPQPGLADLAELAAAAREAGVRVDVSVRADSAGVPAGVQLSAYRIVQEALSNATRHAPGAAVRIDAVVRDGALRVTVANGPGPEPPIHPGKGGHGIRGMRERAAIFGGDVWAGPDGAGGFVVEARLPLDGGTG